jgi:hypothetical protein
MEQNRRLSFTFFPNLSMKNPTMRKTIFLLVSILAACLLSVCPNHLIGQTTNSTTASGNQVPKTDVRFKTTDQTLQKVFDEAEKKAKWNIAVFGKYKVLVEGAEYKNVWLETQPMGGYMYGKRNLEVALNNIQIFMDYQREDGRFPGMIGYKNRVITPYYGWFQGYCFPMSAFELYFWLNKDKEYLNRLYLSLERFDEYLWKTRDSDHDGCLETWCVWDTGEDACVRLGQAPDSWMFDYPPTEERIRNMTKEELRGCSSRTKFDFLNNFPVPMESMDIMSYSYTGRDVLAKISKELGNGKEDYWRGKANEVRAKLKSYLWDEKKHACYDRDKENKVMNILLHNNLRCMYFGSFDQQMADNFVKYHLMNPEEFLTPMPLPSIAANDLSFRNISGNNWSGQPQGLTYQRSISALENYGHYAELTLIGEKFLKVIGDSLKFTQQFDPFNGTINNTLDGYGPSILASLEFISRMYGIQLTQDQVYWSCLENEHQYEYTQEWGDRVFTMKTQGKQVICSINGKEVFSFTKGIRVVSDLSGKIIEVDGIEPKVKKAAVTCDGKTFALTVAPNSDYGYNGKFFKTKEIGFSNPEK